MGSGTVLHAKDPIRDALIQWIILVDYLSYVIAFIYYVLFVSIS